MSQAQQTQADGRKEQKAKPKRSFFPPVVPQQPATATAQDTTVNNPASRNGLSTRQSRAGQQSPRRIQVLPQNPTALSPSASQHASPRTTNRMFFPPITPETPPQSRIEQDQMNIESPTWKYQPIEASNGQVNEAPIILESPPAEEKQMQLRGSKEATEAVFAQAVDLTVKKQKNSPKLPIQLQSSGNNQEEGQTPQKTSKDNNLLLMSASKKSEASEDRPHSPSGSNEGVGLVPVIAPHESVEEHQSKIDQLEQENKQLKEHLENKDLLMRKLHSEVVSSRGEKSEPKEGEHQELEQLRQEREQMARIIAHKTKEIQMLKRELIRLEEDLRETYESKRMEAVERGSSQSGSADGAELSALKEIIGHKDEEITHLKEEREQMVSIINQKTIEIRLLKREMIGQNKELRESINETSSSLILLQKQLSKKKSEENSPRLSEVKQGSLHQSQLGSNRGNSTLVKQNKDLRAINLNLQETLKAKEEEHEKLSIFWAQELDQAKAMLESKGDSRKMERLLEELNNKTSQLDKARAELSQKDEVMRQLETDLTDKSAQSKALEDQLVLVKQSIVNKEESTPTLALKSEAAPLPQDQMKRLSNIEQQLSQKNKIVKVWIDQFQKSQNKRRHLKSEARKEFAVLQRKLNYFQLKTKQDEELCQQLKREVELHKKVAQDLQQQRKEACLKYAEILQKYLQGSSVSNQNQSSQEVAP